MCPPASSFAPRLDRAVTVAELSRAQHAWIPLSDGCRLSARLWLPDATPAPAILEYIPYRKDDITAPQDEGRMAWFAEHGYVCLRVDLRGSGDSNGVLLDQYLAQERIALEVDAWISQDWYPSRGRRYDRHLLGRVQRPTGGGAAPRRFGRDRHVDRRPLRRRRSLHRRL